MGGRRKLTNVIGVDDAPFQHAHRGDVPLIGAVCVGTRLDGVVRGRVRRDGADASARIVALVRASPALPGLRAVLLSGITFGGFNVADVDAIHRALGLPVVVVMKRRPNLGAMRDALLQHVRGGARKWAVLERAPAIETARDLFVQRVGIEMHDVEALLDATCDQAKEPEPLRFAHMIASVAEARRGAIKARGA